MEFGVIDLEQLVSSNSQRRTPNCFLREEKKWDRLY